MSLRYDKRLIPNAKVLRRDMTPQERRLWYKFLSGYPVRFQRQKAIDRYIVDFYCAKAKLVVELDGDSHYSAAQISYDEERTKRLAKYGLKVLRFTNMEIGHSFEEVCMAIDQAVNERMEVSS